ncbi:MAG: acyltransferase domain-containing protein [Eubacteriales bacterium]
MELLELCENIGMPREVTEQVLSYSDFDRQLLAGLTHRETAADTYRALKSRCQSGMELLAYSLQAARLTYEAYRVRGIDERVFSDTMRCFSRFVGETYTNCGVYDFDRGW